MHTGWGMKDAGTYVRTHRETIHIQGGSTYSYLMQAFERQVFISQMWLTFNSYPTWSHHLRTLHVWPSIVLLKMSPVVHRNMYTHTIAWSPTAVGSATVYTDPLFYLMLVALFSHSTTSRAHEIIRVNTLGQHTGDVCAWRCSFTGH